MWMLTNGAGYDPLTQIAHSASLDNGATWITYTSATSVWNNQRTAEGPFAISAGGYEGAIVVLARTKCTTATFDNGVMEMWLGGWDSLTETNSSDTDTSLGTLPYGGSGGLTVGPDELLNNLGWTKNDVGAGATVTQGANGINVVSTAANNSYWTYPWTPQTSDGWRFRLVLRVNSGGTIASDGLAFAFFASDGTNRQWLKLRFSATQIRAIDNSGPIAVATPTAMTGKFMEIFVAFNHDNPAGAGLASVYYRSESGTFWTALIENRAIAEEAGVATEAILVGGSSAVATDWDFVYLGVAEGGKWATGFTNPTHLHGRPISSAVDVLVKNGVRIGSFGGPGIVGDTYDVTTTYQYAARNLWLSPRIPCRWDAADGADQNVVLYAGDLWRADVVTVHGTNYRRATLEMSATNAWIPPAVSVSLDATVWEGKVTSAAQGVIVVDGEPWIPHRFRSTKGRRWFLAYGSVPAMSAEILDNDASTLYVSGLTGLSAGDTIAVYGDRMGALLPSLQQYAYMRLVISSQEVPAADVYFRTGYVVASRKHEIEIPYDSGFVDRYPPTVVVTETDSGHQHVSVMGSEHPQLRIAWGLIDRTSSAYMEKITALFRALDGPAVPVVFWRDVNDVSTIGLYRVTGPVTRENAYGELDDAFDRLAEMSLREETT
jgi:hypothetical protein